MIGGIGVDVVYMPRVARLWKRFGTKFARKFLSHGELLQLSDVSIRADASRVVEFLASRWAVKEAAFKAIGPCEPRTLFTDITVANNLLLRSGSTTMKESPKLMLHGAAACNAKRKGLGPFFVSLSHDGDYAFAQVLVEYTCATEYKTP